MCAHQKRPVLGLGGLNEDSRIQIGLDCGCRPVSPLNYEKGRRKDTCTEQGIILCKF